MAPTLSKLLPRQFGNGDGDRNGDNGPFGDNGGGGVSKWAVIGIVIAIIVIGAIVSFIIFRRMRARRRAVSSAIKLTTPYKPNASASTGPSNSDPTKYAGAGGGYTATADQNHSLLGNAEAPAIVMWNPDHTGSTQDGFGYDNNLHLAGAGIQRPASIASFSAPPPRYEEATNSSAPGSSAGRRPGSGEAASYFNNAVSMGEDARGRSRSVEGSGEATRGRALSVDNRSINADRRRSISRFREEGMVDVSVGKS